jgi:hypothetical protein
MRKLRQAVNSTSSFGVKLLGTAQFTKHAESSLFAFLKNEARRRADWTHV